MDSKTFSIKLQQVENYLFNIDFGEFGNLLADEPEPLGSGEGPNPQGLLAASIANCLCASLLFSIRKYKEDPGTVSAVMTGTVARVDGRLRITHFDAQLSLGVAGNSLSHIEKVLGQFEDFCTITQSVRSGIPVAVTVTDSEGNLLHTHNAST